MATRALSSLLLILSLAGCAPRDTTIEVDPPDAEVALDGTKVVGREGQFRLPLSGRDPSLEYRLILSKPGFETQTFRLIWNESSMSMMDELKYDIGSPKEYLRYAQDCSPEGCTFSCAGLCCLYPFEMIRYPFQARREEYWYAALGENDRSSGGYELRHPSRFVLQRKPGVPLSPSPPEPLPPLPPDPPPSSTP